jgi:hypothetical protein
MALKKTTSLPLKLAFGKWFFLSYSRFFLHADLILPFDTPLVFWGIFWLSRANVKVQKSP